MQRENSLAPSQRLSRFSGTVFLLFAFAISISGQTVDSHHSRPEPARIAQQPIVFPDSVVQEEWTHTLTLVNPRKNLELINPGQCIRVGLVATGDNRDSLLEKSQISFRVAFAGKVASYTSETLAQIKQMKPEGGDFVTAGLRAANLQNPFPTMASLGASASRWCVPADAQDGDASIDSEVEFASSRQHQRLVTIHIESFASGSKHLFKDEGELAEFISTYYARPNPARLITLLERFSTDAHAQSARGVAESMAAFLAAALKSNPIAARDFMERVSAETGFARAFGFVALRLSGFDTSEALEKLPKDERQKIDNLPKLPDPNDMTADSEAATRLDMLWSEFGATGAFAPVRNVADRLAWRPDYEEFKKMRQSRSQQIDWSPAIMRGVTYGAAGWSLSSFQRNDPLVADYVEAMIASHDTTEAEKKDLKELQSDPAFKQ